MTINFYLKKQNTVVEMIFLSIDLTFSVQWKPVPTPQELVLPCIS